MRITRKSQMTLPPAMCKKHGLVPESEVEFVDQPEGALIIKADKTARGKKPRPLPDFFIGAHAYVAHLPLLTRDSRRVRTFFPSVRLITP